MRLRLLIAAALAGCVTVGAPDLSAQRREVSLALSALRPERATREQAFEASQVGASAEARDQATDAFLAEFAAKERAVLEPLAAAGNAEAMYRLSVQLRDGDTGDEVRRWYALARRAADAGHPGAEDELVRWYWHQRGDGSIAAVQANRALALDHADRAAGHGGGFALARVAVYISGDVHQYPANKALARRLLELCVRSGDRVCLEALTSTRPYDYGVAPEDAARAREQAAAPVTWAELRPEWLAIRSAILAHGRSSVGRDTDCITSTPWCRGAFLAVR